MSKARCLSRAGLIFIAGLLPLYLCISSPDPLFGTCKPYPCGNVSISYPFHIIGQQNPNCGFPGFEVTCQNASIPYLNMSGGSYIIRDISYNKQTLRVVNSAFLNSDGSICPAVLRNLTLENDSFKIAESTYTDVKLSWNCSDTIKRRYVQDMVNCGAIAVSSDDPKLSDIVSNCRAMVSLPSEGISGRNSSLKEGLRRGILLSWTTNNCSDCLQSGGRCGFNQTTSRFICYCYDRPHTHQCASPIAAFKSRSKLLIIVSVAAGACALVMLVIAGAICIIKRRHRSTNMHTFFQGTNGMKIENQNVEAFLQIYGSPAPKRYTNGEVKSMTISFKEKIGEGGYGSVYKGRLPNGRLVAVKLLKRSKDTKGEDFINEVASISKANHINVVTLTGYCFQKKKWALIYDFMPNGSLDKYVYSASTGHSLPWETLFSIAIGIARGLDYLHRGCNTRILHFDIKPHNILLDEEFCPKISDFGLARLCPQKDSTISMFEARGTIGYIAPEVFCRNFGGVSHKSDVYSYGMMVLDMVCGRKNVSDEIQRSSETYFPQWIYNQLELGKEVAVEDSEIIE